MRPLSVLDREDFELLLLIRDFARTGSRLVKTTIDARLGWKSGMPPAGRIPQNSTRETNERNLVTDPVRK